MQKTWNFLNGKKTVIGAILSFVYFGAVGAGLIEPNQAIESFLTVVLGVGLGHRALKAGA